MGFGLSLPKGDLRPWGGRESSWPGCSSAETAAQGGLAGGSGGTGPSVSAPELRQEACRLGVDPHRATAEREEQQKNNPPYQKLSSQQYIAALHLADRPKRWLTPSCSTPFQYGRDVCCFAL